MIIDPPQKKQIRRADCTLDGKNIKKEGLINCKPHYFIVLTRETYNKISNHFLGIPLSSIKGNKTDYFRLNFGVDLVSDDIDGSLDLLKETRILCDRPCRISKEDLLDSNICEISITKNKFPEILENVTAFINEGKLKK